jgi:hypothetical protein
MSCIFVVQLRRVCSVFPGDLTIEYSSAEQGSYYYYYARYDSSEPRVYFWREKLPMRERLGIWGAVIVAEVTMMDALRSLSTFVLNDLFLLLLDLSRILYV